MALLKHGKIDNIGGVLAELLEGISVGFTLGLHSTYLCAFTKIIWFYIINVFKLITTGYMLASILLP